MMKTYQIALVALLTLFTISCNNSTKNTTLEATNIELNEGQKWEVNKEMTPFILDSEQLLLQYDGKDYKLLAKELASKNKGLINSCTMDGKSHEELHKWLHPHMELIQDLNVATNNNQADEIISQLKSSFQTYHSYFQ